MKTLTCRDLGGPCDQRLTAGSWDEMVGMMTDHVVENHPATSKQMEHMHEEDPLRWSREMKPKWDAAPEL
jgi:predicted small metal-binding protein